MKVRKSEKALVYLNGCDATERDEEFLESLDVQRIRFSCRNGQFFKTPERGYKLVYNLSKNKDVEKKYIEAGMEVINPYAPVEVVKEEVAEPIKEDGHDIDMTSLMEDVSATPTPSPKEEPKEATPSVKAASKPKTTARKSTSKAKGASGGRTT